MLRVGLPVAPGVITRAVCATTVLEASRSWMRIEGVSGPGLLWPYVEAALAKIRAERPSWTAYDSTVPEPQESMLMVGPCFP